MPRVGGMLTFRTPAGMPPGRRHACDCGLDAVEVVGDRHAERLACLGKRQTAGRAMEQPDAEVAFQHRNVAAYSCRRHRQLPCGFGEAAMGCATDEGFEVCERLHEDSLQRIVETQPNYIRLIPT